MKTTVQKITPHLWFNNKAEEAANFYVSIFDNSKIMSISHYGEAGSEVSGREKDSVMNVIFQLEGQTFMALNGGPVFNFTPAISFFVNCDSQKEVDKLWDRLSEDGEIKQCGWLNDKYGVSWQIIPSALGEMLGDKDPAKSERVMKAMLDMKKIDIEGLRKAYEQQ